MTNDLIDFSPDSLGALELQKLRSPFIGEDNPLLGVQSHHAFHHAAQNRPKLMAIFLQCLDLIRQALAHFVKGGGQEANFSTRSCKDCSFGPPSSDSRTRIALASRLSSICCRKCFSTRLSTMMPR